MAAAKGNNYAAKESKWLSAIERALIRGDGSLNRIADKVVQAAEAGEQWAVLEIGNRLDGKPKQAVDIDQSITHHHVIAESGDVLAAKLAARWARSGHPGHLDDATH